MRVMVTKARGGGALCQESRQEVLEVSEKCGYRGYLGYLYDIIEESSGYPPVTSGYSGYLYDIIR